MIRRQSAAAILVIAGVFNAARLAAQQPNPDPRIGLRAGWMDAAQAAWNMRLVSTNPPPKEFIPAEPGDFGYMNSDIAFQGHYVIQGSFRGFQVWDVSDPVHPTRTTLNICPDMQSDVSVYRHLLFVSGESLDGRVDCGTQGVQGPASPDRFRGIRIYDISDLAHPKTVAAVQTCRGSHTHTVVTDPHDTGAVFVYVSGQAPVRPAEELAGCVGASPDQDTSSALYRLDVIRVPLAAPEKAQIVSHPRIFEGLSKVTAHGMAPVDSIQATKTVDSLKAAGAFAVIMEDQAFVLPAQGFVTPLLDSVVRARGGSGAPTAADSAALRNALQGIVDAMMKGPPTHRGPDQCHDVTVYPALGIGAGACAEYGLLLDIKDAAHPTRIAAASDSNFSYWHSATFNNDGSKVLFTDEWGGGVGPKCRKTDRPQWGADALFTIANGVLTFAGYYKLPVPQTDKENCVAHNGNLIPVPGRDIMVQGWYQGGVSVFDWTDPAHPVEIAFFDRGPMDSTKLEIAGSWSAYWYNGLIYSSEIARGLDVLELQPSAQLTRNELDAAKLVRLESQNVQDQQQIVWPASFAVSRAYVDQLERSHGLAAARIQAVRSALSAAEAKRGAARSSALTSLATQLDRDAATSSDAGKVKTLAAQVRDLAHH
ncbi:MAG: LVIVD repeat-containing protein [Acidobacteriota bacterium]